MLERFREYINPSQFNAIRLSIASPEKIKSLSYGEVKKIETINYRTLKPERDGLFCARIFGPVKDWECNCGKYKRMKHRGVTCEKCGVEVIQSRVRRERMGHINLVSPVCHIWFLKGIPSYLSLILNMTVRDLERVIYFDSYIVLHQGHSPYPPKTILSSQEYDEYISANPEDIMFKADMGAEAIRTLLGMLDLNFEVRKIEEEYTQTTSVAIKHRLAKRYKVLHGMLQANTKPEWCILQILPVLPPDLRPLVPLEGGRFASSDLNDLYRRVLNRNIRLKRLIELEAPDVIIKNEKRMLQESVDALIDNGRRGQPVRGSNRRPLKSLSEMLRGKQGRFRQNLLGKRVDYSGRSVIVVDPELHMHQCGLPKLMALELFKPYVYIELFKRELAPNLRVARRLVEEMSPIVWEALEEVVKDRPVLLNRAPTLHRMSIQAFYPILVEGKAIKIHPLVCSAYNADFDGDQMAVHVPLSKKARLETERLILSTQNILTPASGKPLASPSQDMVLGLYYMTKARKNVIGEGLTFANIEEVIYAYQHQQVNIQAPIKLRLESEKIVSTTVGRVLIYEALPKGSNFDWVNKAAKKKDLVNLVSMLYRTFGKAPTVDALDKIKTLGFSYATLGGISLSIDNLMIPDAKEKIVAQAKKDVKKIEDLYLDGAITNGERKDKVVQIWFRATEDVANAMIALLEEEDNTVAANEHKQNTPFNPVFLMLDSGARSTRQQIRQLAGMRGPMAKPSGEIMETPVLANFKEGLTSLEYFVSTHGARKGLADTALKTADSGYLTRRLVDVAQDVVITQKDCQTLGYITISDLKESGDVIVPLIDRAYGRVAAEDVKDPVSGKLIAKQDELFDDALIEKIKDSAITEIAVRSVLTCQAKHGVCSKCYGMDLSTLELVDTGLAVGVIAAQSIGEPGTQLTMRTFHIGGIASGVASHNLHKAGANGKVVYKNVYAVQNRHGTHTVMNRKASLVVASEDGRELGEYNLEYGSILLVKDGTIVTKGDKLAEWEDFKVILTEKAGKVEFVNLIENVTYREHYDEAAKKSSKIILEKRDEKRQPCIVILDNEGGEIARYYLPTGAVLTVADGDKVHGGDVLAKLELEEKKTKDIIGGLPRVAELFEARIPRDPAILSEVDGTVKFSGVHRGMRRITVTTDDNEVIEYNIPRNRHLNVEDGERVKVGDQLSSGAPNVHDILRILGPDEVQKYLVKEIQEIYALQGVHINDKHIELIVRQMLRKVRVIDPGDTKFVVGDRLAKLKLKTINQLMIKDGKKPATTKPLLMGITKASLGTESFLSAASFQETTRILSETSLTGGVDHLYGLKENVLLGKLIPAGTGVSSFKLKYLGEDISEFEQKARDEEKLEIKLDNISLSDSSQQGTEQ
ncbi:MAG: DNA-directed RNA polymerase subunit beta' [Epsilonproteobacteria bacterium]|nr:DNA-directed RNA polymerase subunit beta' [Campylobacterota bacterium]